MSTQIYYFSGTGNSLHVARELEKRLPGADLVPIISVLKDDHIAATAETVGLVFPIHNLSAPIPVTRFLQRIDLGSAQYIFAVATRFCSDKVFQNMDKQLAKQNKSLDAYFSVEMPCTYIPLFTLPSADTVAEMEAVVRQKLDAIQAVVVSKQTDREKDSPLVFLMGHILYPLITTYMSKVRLPDLARSFYADEKCTGCGLCEKVCLADRIRMQDGRPEWLESIDCLYCFAGLHYCPVEAIQIKGRKTIAKGRYHHADVKAADIARQKRRT